MEFFNQGNKFNPSCKPVLKKTHLAVNTQVKKETSLFTYSSDNVNSNQTKYSNLQDNQLSLLHTRGTLVAALQFINSLNNTNLKIEDWTKIHPIVLFGEKTLTETQLENIMKFITMGFFKIRATNTIEGSGGLKEWLKNQHWNLDVSNINLTDKDVVVAARSTIRGLSWSHNLRGGMIMEKKPQLGFNTMQIKGGHVLRDGLGHRLGIYNLDFKGHKLSVRITDLTYSRHSYEEIMNNHRQDTGFTKIPGVSGFCFAPFKINLTAATMRAIQGAELDAWKVVAVAGDGILQVNHQQPCNYDLRTVAMICYRSFSINQDIPNIVNLFHQVNGRIFVTFLVELFIDDQEILAVMGDQNNLC